MNQQEIFTYIQKQYPVHPDTITKSGYPVTIFKNPRTAAPYVIFYQSAERTTFMEVQAEPDMIGNYIEMYHLAPAKHMDQKHWLAVLGFLKMVTGYPDLVMVSGWTGYCFWMYVNISCWFMGIPSFF